MYKLIVHDLLGKRGDDDSAVTKTRWISLRSSLKYSPLLPHFVFVTV
jgi:hypothetical protein